MENLILLIASGLVLVSIVASRMSSRLGVPALIVFLGVGIVAGGFGLRQAAAQYPNVIQLIAVVALVNILFSGGLDTTWSELRPVLGRGLLLATIGLIVNAIIVAFAMQYLFATTFDQGLLFGSIIGCTDAAAVFGILRTRRMMLRSGLGTMAELESATNDPMAVFLALSLIEILKTPGETIWHLVPSFFIEMGLGSVVGIAMGFAIPWAINVLDLAEQGLYPPLSLGFAILAYAAAATIGGSGFLAAYVAGVVMNTRRYYHKKSIARFHSGFSWLMQIAMFITLGLLLKPTALSPLIGSGLVISLFILLVARPVSVFGSLLFTSLNWREKLMASWLGLRGAVPIILATLTLYSGLADAQLIFDLVFFVVLLSVLVQGTTLTQVAGWLQVLMPMTKKHLHKAHSGAMLTENAVLQEVIVPDSSAICGESVMSLGLSEDGVVMLIHRDDETIMPTGRTRIESGDVLEILADDADMSRIRSKIETAAS